MTKDNRNKPKLGVSACLLGKAVRHDGGHKRARFVTDKLAEYFEFVSVCPEVAIGLGTPRPAMHLVGKPAAPELIEIGHPENNYTQAMETFAEHIYQTELEEICGYILKSKSPSCGMERVRVYHDNGIAHAATTAGIYAAKLMAFNPSLPLEEEGRLNDAVLRENFLERVYVYQRWQQMVASGLSMQKLIDFHTRHKMILMSRSSDALYQLGRMLGENKQPVDDLAAEYFTNLMQILKKKATHKSHVNVLMHIMGYLKKSISAQEKQEMLAVLTSYRKGYVPLVAPLTLLKHHFNTHPDDYITNQYYLDPYPEALMLRNI